MLKFAFAQKRWPVVMRPTAVELEAARDVIARVKAANSRIRKADELLVCAALAILAGEFGGVATRAAETMGKIITKPKLVNDWVARIRLLEQTSVASPSRGGTSNLLVHPAWVELRLPGVQQVEVGPLVLSSNKLHGRRSIRAISTTPGGSTHPTSAVVDYSLPPPEDERERERVQATRRPAPRP